MSKQTIYILGVTMVVVPLLIFIYIVSGGLYRIVPLSGCTVCAYKINKLTGATWYIVRDREFPVMRAIGAGKGFVFNPHTGKMEPE